MEIGMKISSLINQKKIKKSDLSNKLLISRNTLDDYLNDRTSPTVNTLEKIANVLEVPITFFFSEDQQAIKHFTGIDRVFDVLKEVVKERIK